MTTQIIPTSEPARPRASVSLASNMPAPWEIHRHQQAVMHLAWEGRIHGSVLDVGCGTGENALFLAQHGLAVTGIDISEPAIRRARQKGIARGLAVDFRVQDALSLEASEEQFDTVLDCGLLHILDPAERTLYARSIACVLRPGGRYLMLCFSERAPGYVGPACLRSDEIRGVFGRGWRVERVEEARFELRQGYVPGWLASVRRLTGPE